MITTIATVHPIHLIPADLVQTFTKPINLICEPTCRLLSISNTAGGFKFNRIVLTVVVGTKRQSVAVLSFNHNIKFDLLKSWDNATFVRHGYLQPLAETPWSWSCFSLVGQQCIDLGLEGLVHITGGDKNKGNAQQPYEHLHSKFMTTVKPP